ncbi:MAG: hypothetical protein ACLSVD_17655 [Eggerthellaceae bacterium]
MAETDFDIIVVGSGCAGAVAATRRPRRARACSWSSAATSPARRT